MQTPRPVNRDNGGLFFFNKDTIGNSLKVMGTKVQGGDGLPSFINLGNLVGLRILLQG